MWLWLMWLKMLTFALNIAPHLPISCLQGFFISLRLVALAQSGHDVSLNNLSQIVAAPKFVSVEK